MEVEFDPAKDAANILKHGLSLAEFVGFEEAVGAFVDDRRDYGETRYRAFGRIAGRGYCLVYTETIAGIRAISLRRAREKELRRYER